MTNGILRAAHWNNNENQNSVVVQFEDFMYDKLQFVSLKETS